MGGSQLKQLSGALRDAGLSKSSNRSSKKGKQNNNALDPAKRAAKLSKIQESFNHFDLKHERVKHDDNRKNKVAGRPSTSKQSGIELRRKQLLPELQRRGKTGSIVDRRFGESNPHLDPQDKAIERFKSERSSRPSKFDIEDSSDNLTHFGRDLFGENASSGWGGGQKLSLKEKEQDSDPDPDDQQDPESETTHKKSRQEIMNEVIAKSKHYKAERQKAKEEDDDLRLELDGEMKELLGLLNAPAYNKAQQQQQKQQQKQQEENENEKDENENENDKQETPSAVDRALLAKLLGDDDADDDESKSKEPTKEDDYDKAVRSLFYDRRARPTDRLKTADELAFEAAEALKTAEESRRKRMVGEERSERPAKKARGEGDDLDDDYFENEDDDFLGAGLEDVEDEQEEEEDSDQDDEDDDGGSSEEGESDKDTDDALDNDAESEQENLELDSASEQEEDEDEDGPLESLTKSSTMTSKESTSSNSNSTDKKDEDDIPYSFDCPTDHESLMNLIDGKPEDSIFKVMDRVRVLYHPRLGEGNKLRLEQFATVVLDHLIYLCSLPEPPTSTINTLFGRVCNAIKGYTQPMAQHFVYKLVLMQRNLTKGLKSGGLESSSKTWPGFPELAFLKVIGKVWSTSDKNHPVSAPAILLICQYLSQCRVRQITDVTSGLFLCKLYFEYEAYSKRIVPEVVNFLGASLLLLCPTSFDSSNVPGYFPTPDFARPELSASLQLSMTDKQSSKLKSEPLGLLSVIKPTNNDDNDDKDDVSEQQKLDHLNFTLDLIQKLAELLIGLEAFSEVLEPFVKILENVLEQNLINSTAKEKVEKVCIDLKRQIKVQTSTRKYLQLQSHKPIPIPSYIPKFDDAGSKNRFDPDSSRNENARLKAMVKKEKKGALKELRKDNKFIATEKAKAQREADADYARKMNKVKTILADERNEEKQQERIKKREKAKDKRRSGRRS